MPDINLNLLDTYTMMALQREIVPEQTFFIDRYFRTGPRDIFSTKKVLVEYKKGDRKMACFVSPRIGDIPVDRLGYKISEYEPAFIAPSRKLGVDELNERGFGEAIYSADTPAQRAARLMQDDLSDLDRRIVRLEEWMAVQTMLNNACEMQEYVDENTVGEKLYVRFYDQTSDHTYTVSTKWDASGADIRGDVRNMCKMLSRRGLPAADLLLGIDAADVFESDAEIRALLDRNLQIDVGAINETVEYPGVTHMGRLNFHGFKLDVFTIDEHYEDAAGNDQPYFPAKGVVVTAPDCGHKMYGAITQINYGDKDNSTIAAARVPKLVIDQAHDMRKIRLAARPLLAPRQYCPYIYAANAVN